MHARTLSDTVPQESPALFLRNRAHHWDLGLQEWAQLAGQGTTGIFLPPPQSLDCSTEHHVQLLTWGAGDYTQALTFA